MQEHQNMKLKNRESLVIIFFLILVWRTQWASQAKLTKTARQTEQATNTKNKQEDRLRNIDFRTTPHWGSGLPVASKRRRAGAVPCQGRK